MASETVDSLAVVALAVNPVLLIVVGVIIKRWADKLERGLERLEKAIEAYGKAQTECQISLAKTYRTKTDAEADSAKQWARLDDLNTRMTRVETILAGDGK